MSEMDDELRRLTETPEERAARAHAEDVAAMESAAAASASHEQALKNVAAELQRRQAAYKERRAHWQALRQQYRWPLRFTALALAASTAAGAVFGVRALSEVHHETTITYGLEPQLTSVEDLQASGACADELQAESSLATDRSKLANNDGLRRTHKAAAYRFAAAGRLAAQYDVSCSPGVAGSENLTPNFDVATLESNHECADEILARQVDTSQANNNQYRKFLN